jgi:hypothetical protein
MIEYVNNKILRQYLEHASVLVAPNEVNQFSILITLESAHWISLALPKKNPNSAQDDYYHPLPLTQNLTSYLLPSHHQHIDSWPHFPSRSPAFSTLH